ncbi:hypothetical protein BGZ99_004405 [Dissophora globulifera]|uniref:C2H2-type domain-containing protein n=1 Tax=Dissophora globulifera TaxID=979702 RepID=A0A9P6RI27_9FUNG|nr:hypothetical protein BGZ99_004405 [Dissophora globulifera]
MGDKTTGVGGDKGPSNGGEAYSCPMCQEPFFGDIAAFEDHVQQHFAEDDRHQEAALIETPLAATTAPISDVFKIECEVPGCKMIVSVDEMVVHMDRHLAQKLQGFTDSDRRISQKSKSTVGNPSPIRARSSSPSTDDLRWNESPRKWARISSPDAQERNLSPGAKTTGQTTMDGFMKRTPQNTATQGISSLRSAQFTFTSDIPSTATGTTGLIAKAGMLLKISQSQRVTKQAYLADLSTAFYQSDKTDHGWGCGYRNIQMILSYVVSRTAPRSRNGPGPTLVPTITELQQQLEFAWTNGFDPSGAEQLGHKVEGTRKWIGTTEAWSVLSSLGIRCSILDFHSPTGLNGTHPAMLSAVYNYFRTPAWSPLAAPPSLSISSYDQPDLEQRIIQTAKPPLYMQHQGHSRTIIGVELLQSGELNLLVFDPGRWLHKTIPTLREESISKVPASAPGSKLTTERGLLDAQYLLKAFRLQLTSGNSKSQYQLLGISGLSHDGGIENGVDAHQNGLHLFQRNARLSLGWTEEEARESKAVTSTRVP